MTAYADFDHDWDALKKPGDCDDFGFIGADGDYHFWEDEGLGDPDDEWLDCEDCE